MFQTASSSNAATIESASQDPLEFHDIPQVEQVHSLLYHEVFDALEER